MRHTSTNPAADVAILFAELMLPAGAEFLEDQADKRRGRNVCLALASVSGHHFHALGAAVDRHRDANSYRQSHCAANWAVGISIGIANATKPSARCERPAGWGSSTCSHKTSRAGQHAAAGR